MYKHFIFALLIILLASCARHEVRLNFDLTEGLNFPCRILFYEQGETGGVFRETVAEIRDGKGKFRLNAYHPSLIFLYTTSGKAPSAIIYANPGDDIKIHGEGEDISKWKVSGNKVTEELSDWINENADLLHGKKGKELDDAISKYVEKHPHSLVSAILLYLYFDRRTDEKGFHSLQAIIDGEVLENPDLLRVLAMADHIGGLPDEFSIPEIIVKIGENGYADTLDVTHKRATLFIFRNGTSGSPVIYNDSIEKFIDKYHKFEVVELYGETDSLVWRKEIKRDTIEGLRRFWLPLGVTDSVALSMGVKRMPYLLLVDSLLKEHYRGSDWNEATKAAAALK